MSALNTSNLLYRNYDRVVVFFNKMWTKLATLKVTSGVKCIFIKDEIEKLHST